VSAALDIARAISGEIVYSQCWEDPRTAAGALSLRDDDDLLVITSGGCNALALSLEGPRTVTAVDLNPAQGHLLELKIAAIRALDHPSLLAFLGVRPCADRVAIYADAIRALLPDPAGAFWDRRPGAIAGGVIHAGRFERYLALFRRFVLPLMHGHADVERLLALDSLDEQRRFYERVWDGRRWRGLFVLFFGRAVQSRLGRHREFFRFVDVRDVGRHYRERARYALVDLPIAENYFVEYILTGAYRSEDRMPPYLRASDHARLRASVDRIRVVAADVGSFLAGARPASYSAFSFSDVFEWMPATEHEAILKETVRAARAHARICYYENLVVRRAPPCLRDVLETDDITAELLHRQDRSFLYRAVVVGRVRGPRPC
jgi:S-adenosylmethionine-diacylglycerol 3-amino-3-carboxypropyl transferase